MPADVDASGFRVAAVDGAQYILAADGLVLFSSRGHAGTAADARALVTAHRGMAALRDRVEAIGSEVGALRRQVAEWRTVSGCNTPDRLDEMLARLKAIVWPYWHAAVRRDADPILVKIVEAARLLLVAEQEKARTAGVATRDAQAARVELDTVRHDLNAARAKTAPELILQVQDLEAKRAAWQDRANAAETRQAAAEKAASGLSRGLAGAMKALRRPKVGVAVLVRRADGRLLMQRRKGSHGAGTWSVPGGHMEPYDETVEAAMERELAEETGIARPVAQIGATTLTHFGGDHGTYVTLYGVCDVWANTEAELREPDKCEEWRWVLPNELPEPLFAPLKALIQGGVDPWTVHPTHPLLAAACYAAGIVDQRRFVAANLGARP